VEYRTLTVNLDETGCGEAEKLLAAPSSWNAGFVPAATVTFDAACQPYDGTITVTIVDLASGYEHWLWGPYGDPPAHGAEDQQVQLSFYVGRGLKVKVVGGPPSIENAVTVFVFVA
jgi:hypothetical protein